MYTKRLHHQRVYSFSPPDLCHMTTYNTAKLVIANLFPTYCRFTEKCVSIFRRVQRVFANKNILGVRYLTYSTNFNRYFTSNSYVLIFNPLDMLIKISENCEILNYNKNLMKLCGGSKPFFLEFPKNFTVL